ncbi:ExeA family protein [Yoonia sp. 2307UL14-13]|uniref:ExeA family protein n=1 Tax=Yoonia sp. 2307UL14-13 TaxID=3126506 RepID=UPI0030A8648B
MNDAKAPYTNFFGLTERPFSLLPDPDFLYWTDDHKRAYTMLEYGVMTHAPITLITGEVGAGKTTLMQHLLNNLDEDLTIGLVSNAHGDRGELLRWVLMALAQPADPEANYVDLFTQFQEYLIAEYAAGRRVMLIFDEAQNMSRESLEELRMFTNINANKDELLQLILIGQPELRDIIRRVDMRQFAQRVAASFHLSHMDEKTVYSYIIHRLERAGGRQHMFSKKAAELVYEATKGIPRLVNQLCDLSMLYAFTARREIVGPEHVSAVLSDGAFFAPGTENPEDGPQI